MVMMFSEIKDSLKRAFFKNRGDSILLSGGLDSSVLAAFDSKMTAVTINLDSYGDDRRYSKRTADFLGMKRLSKAIGIEEAVEAIPEVIKTLKSFDPAIPNDLAAYFGLKFGRENGLSAMVTGDGSDEIFGGYDFMRNIPDLGAYIKRISQKMFFSSNELAASVGIGIRQPYMDEEVVNLALNLPVEYKIREESGTTHGKWALRKAFEDILPGDIIWQKKRPLEYGSGMTELRNFVSAKIADEEFRENASGMKFISKEHYYYYKVYRRVVGNIPGPQKGEKECPGCGGGMGLASFHCKICGHVMDWRRT